jgi:predicted nucleic acid-binding protein
MQAKRNIVSNTSPLIGLSAIGKIELLPLLFTRVLIPVAVEKEVRAGAKLASQRDQILQVFRSPWAEIVPVPSSPLLLSLRERLGAGEAESIILALNRDLPVLLDDLEGRKAAFGLKMDLIRTLGVLGRAKTAGAISAVKPLVEALKIAGIFYADSLVQRFLEAMGEA